MQRPYNQICLEMRVVDFACNVYKETGCVVKEIMLEEAFFKQLRSELGIKDQADVTVRTPYSKVKVGCIKDEGT